MATKSQKLKNAKPAKLKIRAGDQVVITAGKDKGEKGFVAAISPKKQKAIILQENPENPDEPLPLNTAVKHKKARYQGEKSARFRFPAPIHISNLMVLDPESGDPSRIGRRLEDGKMVRYVKKTGNTIVDKPNLGDSSEKA